LKAEPILQALAHDLRFAIRSLWRSPGFTLVAVLSLGLGLGANTALFSLVDALLIRSLPVREPARLFSIGRVDPATGKPLPMDRAAVDALGRHSLSDGALAWSVLAAPLVAIDGEVEPGRTIARVTEGFFQVLGVGLALGRSEASEPAVVLGHQFWNARFHREPQALSRMLSIDGQVYPIIGVAAAGFYGVSMDTSVDAWIVSRSGPLTTASAIVRLKSGVDPETAAAAADVLLKDLSRSGVTGGATAVAPRVEITPVGRGSSSLREQYRGSLIALMGLVVLVLLITCTNVGNLLVVRNTRRVRELTVRSALGAARSRLVLHLVTEALVLASLGTVVAWLVARWAVAALLSTLPVGRVPDQLQFDTDVRVLLFMAATALASATLFASVGAWKATRIDSAGMLRTMPVTAASAGSRRIGSALIAAQIALSVVLLTGAAVFVRTVWNVTSLDLGFDPERLLQIELADRAVRYRPEEARIMNEQLLERVAAVPGVESVTFFNQLFALWSVGQPQPASESGFVVGPRFFETTRMSLRRGRWFRPDDLTRSEGVVVVNEAFARQMFPGEEVIGKRAGFSQLEVVGVVGDATMTNVRWKEPAVYRLALRESRLAPALLVRTAAEPSGVIRPIQQAVASVNPRLFVAARTVDALVGRSIARERMVATVSVFLGALGAALTGVGLFGVAAFAVAYRTSELGVRIALGASRWDVIRESLRGTARVLAIGLAGGVAAAIAGVEFAGNLLSALVFGLTPSDWSHVAAATLVMIVVALMACVLPAIRATRIDPLRAIRHEN